MKSVLAVLVISVALPRALTAQAVVSTQKALDPAKAEVRDALVQLRDSLIQIQAGVAQLDRGADAASDALLRSRARSVAVACEHAGRVLPGVRKIVAKGEWDREYPTRRQRELLQHFDRLAPVLDQCGREWRSMAERSHVAEARSKAVERGAALRKSTINFQLASENFLLSIDVRVRPKGAGPSPFE